jgi:hypothetical protein
MRRAFPSWSVVLSPAVALLILSTASGGTMPVSSGADASPVQPSQAVTEDWRDADYGFNARMMAADSEDSVYALGDTPVGDYLVVKKFTASGVLQWQATHDPAERLRGVWIAVDSGKNTVVLASMITGSNYQPAGWLTLKYDADGALLWARALPGPFRDARRVAVDAGDNIYVAGRMWLTNPSGSTTHDSVLIKYSPDGNPLWTAVFDAASANDEPYSMVLSPDGTRIGVAGISGNLFMALMYDSDGNRLWADTDDVAYAANDLAFGPGNVTYFATGTYFPNDPNPYQMAIRAFDAAGNPLYLRSYSVGDRTLRVRVDGQGNVVATGMDQAGYMDWITIKTDASGALLWSRRYDAGRNNDETPNMLLVDADGAVYVTGRGGPNPAMGTVSYLKGVIVKYDAEGSPRWAAWDPYANGGAVNLGAGNTLASLAWAYLVAAHYTETGLIDPVPAAPGNLAGFASQGVSGYEVRLSFTDNADNEFWVEAERCTGAGCTTFTKVAQSRGEDGTGLADASVVQGATYTYRVAARGFMGLSGYSNTFEITVPPASPPAAPSNLSAAMSGDDVRLSWQDNSNNETQFYVERCQGAGCGAFMGVGASPPDVPTWTDYTVAAGQSYSYRVRAWNLDGFSPYSNTVTIVTPGGPPPSPPPAPSGLAAQPLGPNQIRLTWTNNGVDQDAVKIERCRGNWCTDFVQVATVAGTAAIFTDSGLTARTRYRYRVRAHNAAGDSPYSNVAAATTSRR